VAVVNLYTFLTWHMKDQNSYSINARMHTAASMKNITAFVEYRDKVFSISHYL